MKLGDRYYSIGEHIRNVVITLVIFGLTLFLSGVRLGCTEKVNAKCIGTSISYYIDQHADSYGLISPSEYKEELVKGIYRYEVNGQIYDWVDDTPFGIKNPTENNTYKITINPNNPSSATMINIIVLIIGSIISMVILYGTLWSIVSNKIYIKKNGKT
ncbi:MAG: hypothetical protein E7258_01860 [Lachnospiraceae bacterium]|nr:hypothetical protein [Lachnospiraceae bacterium]